MTIFCSIFQAKCGMEGLRHESRILYFVFGDADHYDRVAGEQRQTAEYSPGYSTLHDCRHESVSSA